MNKADAIQTANLASQKAVEHVTGLPAGEPLPELWVHINGWLTNAADASVAIRLDLSMAANHDLLDKLIDQLDEQYDGELNFTVIRKF